MARVAWQKLSITRNADGRFELALDWRVAFTSEEVRWNAFYNEGIELAMRQGSVDDWTPRTGLLPFTEADPWDLFLGTLAVQYFRPSDTGHDVGPLTLSRHLAVTATDEQQRQLSSGGMAYAVIHLEPDIPSPAVGWAFAELPAIADAEGMKVLKVAVPNIRPAEDLVRFDPRIVSSVLEAK